MILEEIEGTLVATVIRENGQTTELQVGDYFNDHESGTLIVTGNGKVTVRVDQNCTFEVRATPTEETAEPVVETAAEPVVETAAEPVVETAPAPAVTKTK